MNWKYLVVVGAKMKKDQYVKDHGKPWEMDEKDNCLIASDGFEANFEDVVVGKIVHRFAKHGDESIHGIDLQRKYMKNKAEVQEALEREGIDRPVSIYTIASLM